MSEGHWTEVRYGRRRRQQPEQRRVQWGGGTIWMDRAEAIPSQRSWKPYSRPNPNSNP